jgi:hypothetical protein
LNDFDVFQIIEKKFMGARDGAQSVKLNKMQVIMNMQGQVTGRYFSTLLDMEPNTCNLCHIDTVLIKLYWKNNVNEFLEIQNAH